MRAPRGQALLLACLVVLLLALAVIANVQLGHAVDQRIRLQDTADAAAYSMAAAEARAFNFYAFANRTQVSHYVSAMLFHSTLSFLYFGEAFLTDVYGVMLTLNPCGGDRDPFWQAACPALEGLPGIGPVLAFMDRMFLVYERLVQTYQRVLRASGADEVIGRGVIPALHGLNEALALASTTVMESALAEVATTSDAVIAANDPEVKAGAGRALTGGLSACLFDRAHYREGNGSPLAPNLHPEEPLRPSERREHSRTARAKRAMGQIANASRYACDGEKGCPETFLTSRRLGDLVPWPSWMAPVRGFLNQLPKWGQTRLLSQGLGKGWDDRNGGNFLREPVDTPDAPASMLAQGDNLGADDLYSLQLGPARLGPFANPLACDGRVQRYWECWGDPRHGLRDPDGQRPYRFMMKASVWATNDDETEVATGGVHWRVAFPGHYPAGRGHVEPTAINAIERDLGLNRIARTVAPGVQVSVMIANVRPIEDGNHRWPGLAPFPHFEPGQYAEACAPMGSRGGEPSSESAALRRSDFNQPSTWALLDKDLPSLFAVTSGPRTVFRTEVDLGAKGIQALSRAQVYYHRPGNWAEHPNFFNPYWRPRLAATLQGRDVFPWLSAQIAKLPVPLAAVPQKALTH